MNTLPGVAFLKSSTLTRSWIVAQDRRTLRINSVEVLPSGPFESGQSVSTSFDIKDIAPRGGDTLFVVGAPARGGFLVEQWSLPDVAGVTTSRIATPGVGIGTSLPAPGPGTVFVPGGGMALPPAERRDPPAVRRQIVAEDVSVTCQAIGADPEGRFLILVTGDGQMRQYPLDDGSGQPLSPAVLSDTGSIPSIEHVKGHLFHYDHESLGRVWFGQWHDARYPDGSWISPPNHECVVMHDPDNDGVFDLIDSFPVASSSLNFYFDTDGFTDNFRYIP